jgi:hypothetical protein
MRQALAFAMCVPTTLVLRIYRNGGFGVSPFYGSFEAS